MPTTNDLRGTTRATMVLILVVSALYLANHGASASAQPALVSAGASDVVSVDDQPKLRTPATATIVPSPTWETLGTDAAVSHDETAVSVLAAPLDTPAELPITKPVLDRSVLSAERSVAFLDDFAEESAVWSTFTGEWAFVNGEFVQSNSNGYDFIVQLRHAVPSSFVASVDMRAISGDLGGGLILGQPELDAREGGYIIDFAGQGGFLRWG